MTSDFKKLAKTLSKLEKVSKQIISTSLNIMEKLQENDNELLDDAMEDGNIDDDRKDGLLEIMRETSMKWTRDAKTVLDELPFFVVEDDGVYVVETESENCSFLSEVWNGDYYDQTGNDGLNELLNDLNFQLEKITEENLIEKSLVELR